MEAAADLNEHKETHEKEKDERKKTREEGTQPAALDLKCEKPGCYFVGQTKAGFVNYVRQRHSSMALVAVTCLTAVSVFGSSG